MEGARQRHLCAATAAAAGDILVRDEREGNKNLQVYIYIYIHAHRVPGNTSSAGELII